MPPSDRTIGKLVLSVGGRVLRELLIDRKRVTIGRRPYNDLLLDDLTVSGEHAIVHTGPKGESVVHDLQSRNGTLVNGMPVMQQVLADGDVIDVGIYRIVYCTERLGFNVDDFVPRELPRSPSTRWLDAALERAPDGRLHGGSSAMRGGSGGQPGAAPGSVPGAGPGNTPSGLPLGGQGSGPAGGSLAGPGEGSGEAADGALDGASGSGSGSGSPLGGATGGVDGFGGRPSADQGSQRAQGAASWGTFLEGGRRRGDPGQADPKTGLPASGATRASPLSLTSPPRTDGAAAGANDASGAAPRPGRDSAQGPIGGDAAARKDAGAGAGGPAASGSGTGGSATGGSAAGAGAPAAPSGAAAPGEVRRFVPPPLPSTEITGFGRVMIRYLGGHDAGREVVMDRPIVSIRNGSGQVAVVARRPGGYFLTHLEGLAYPLVNGESIGLGAHALQDNDLIELAGTILQFCIDGPLT